MGSKKPPMVQYSVKLDSATDADVRKIAAHEERKASPTLRLLVKRGIAAYLKDGLLVEPKGGR